MDEPTTLVTVRRLAFGVVTTEDDHTPVLGVIRVETPSGDRVNLLLTPRQVDDATSGLSSLAVELMLK